MHISAMSLDEIAANNDGVKPPDLRAQIVSGPIWLLFAVAALSLVFVRKERQALERFSAN